MPKTHSFIYIAIEHHGNVKYNEDKKDQKLLPLVVSAGVSL
jgi:hypothetical protein